MKRLFFTSLVCLLSLSACLRLDDNLFNISEKIKEYKYDKYTGNADFTLGPEYQVSDSLISTFELYSKTPNESSSTKIFATYLGDINKIKTDTVILYCHGNRWHMDFYWPRAKLLAHTGSKHRYGVLMLDYRGYGLSEGKPSEEGLYADVEATLNWLKNNGLTNDRLIMYGFSMGTAPATMLTAHPRSLIPSKIILEAPFASAEVMAEDAAVIDMPASYVTDLKINNAEEIKLVKQDFLWIHGTQDLFLNIKTHGQVVYNNHHGLFKRDLKVKNADHGTIQTTMGFRAYSDSLLAFITR